MFADCAWKDPAGGAAEVKVRPCRIRIIDTGRVHTRTNREGLSGFKLGETGNLPTREYLAQHRRVCKAAAKPRDLVNVMNDEPCGLSKTERPHSLRSWNSFAGLGDWSPPDLATLKASSLSLKLLLNV